MFGGRYVVIKNSEGRGPELAALMKRFKVKFYQKFIGNKPLPEFVFIGGKVDFFLAQLREAGFEYEERAGDEG